MKFPLAPLWLIALALSVVPANSLPADESCHLQQDKNKKPVAGKADVLRHLPKKYAAFVGHDDGKQTVTLHIEGEKAATTWKLSPNVEIKVRGWWGRLSQIQKGDRLWVWFAIDRAKKPRGVLMLADEISEQDIHSVPAKVEAFEPRTRTLTVRSVYNKKRTMQLADGVQPTPLQKGDGVYLQSNGSKIRVLLSLDEMKKVRAEQQAYLRQQWRKHGLPGMVSFLHPLGGEMEVMLDHEGKRWGRYLKNGASVTITIDQATGKPIKAAVRKVEPWREYTRLSLVTDSGTDQLDLTAGQRIRAKVPEPPKRVQLSPLPTDIGRLREREERTEWFLASVYCTCKIKGDRCTGMFYSLASCNRNACGNPNYIRRLVHGMIDKGLTDEQIFERLLKMRGHDLLHPHLLK